MNEQLLVNRFRPHNAAMEKKIQVKIKKHPSLAEECFNKGVAKVLEGCSRNTTVSVLCFHLRFCFNDRLWNVMHKCL